VFEKCKPYVQIFTQTQRVIQNGKLIRRRFRIKLVKFWKKILFFINTPIIFSFIGGTGGAKKLT